MLAAIIVAATPQRSSPQVVFNEVMYHSSSGKRTEEFVELLNASDKPVDLTAWQITDGIRYLFPPGTTLAPGDYLLVAAAPEKLAETLGNDAFILGPYEKKLSHKADRLELRRPDATLVDLIEYEDDAPWPEDADGKGPSLERVNPAAPSNEPAAWRASAELGGTPAKRNSVFDPGATLWLAEGRHTPLIPNSSTPIRLSVESIGTPDPKTLTAEWWIDGNSDRTTVALNPDPQSPRRWIATIGPFPDRTLIEYRFLAGDEEDHQHAVFPAARKNQPQGHLVQVDDMPVTGTRPLYRLLVRKKDWDALHARPVESNDLLPGTFIADDFVCQRAGFRYRGSSSRLGPTRKSYLIRFPRFETFLDRRDHAFNANHYKAQYLAMKLLARAGVEAPRVEIVGLRINGDWTGHYCWMEEIDHDFARYHFNDPDKVRIWEAKRDADLSYRGPDPKNYTGYQPVSPDKDLDPSPIIGLCQALREKTPIIEFEYSALRSADVDEWMRYFACNALIANIEGGINTTKGEDYYIAQPSFDSLFLLLPWDVNESMLVPYFPITSQQVPTVKRFLSYPPFAVRYRTEVKRQLETLLDPRSVHDMIAEVKDLEDPLFEGVVQDFLTARPHEVAAQLPDSVSFVIHKPGPHFLAGFGSNWKLFHRPYPPKGDPGAWTTVEYPDTMENEWFDAAMPMGYSPEGLLNQKSRGSYIPPRTESEEMVTFYVRRRFIWNESEPPENLRLLLRASAGYIVYLNGEEISRGMLPQGPIFQKTRALALQTTTTPVAIDLRPFTRQIRDGENVIAIESHMTSLSDPRRVLDAVLLEGPPQVGTVVLEEPKLQFDGKAPVPPVAEVGMAGEIYPVDAWKATWEGETQLEPGWNRFLLSGRGNEGDTLATSTVSLYYADKATPAPKRIDHQVVWMADNSPYRITESLEIGPEAFLRIEAGTVVVVEPWANIVCRGRLVADGKPDAPVTIAALDALAPWGSIAGVGPNSQIEFRYTNISGCSNCFDIPAVPRRYTLAGVEMWGGTLRADHTTIRDATGAAFGAGGGADAILRHCRMEHTGCGFMAWDAAWTLEDCVVLHTRNKGDGIDIDREGPRPSVARRCVFADLDDDGIDFASSNATVEQCVVWGARDKGISIDAGGTSTFRECLIGDADKAMHVKFGTSANVERSALLASRIGLLTDPATESAPSSAVKLDDSLIALCASPLQIAPESLSVQNVFVDSIPDDENASLSTAKGKLTPGLAFRDPRTGDWTVIAPMPSGTVRDWIGLPMSTLLDLATQAGVEVRETGLRLLESE